MRSVGFFSSITHTSTGFYSGFSSISDRSLPVLPRLLSLAIVVSAAAWHQQPSPPTSATNWCCHGAAGLRLLPRSSLFLPYTRLTLAASISDEDSPMSPHQLERLLMSRLDAGSGDAKP
jgi:hypothetical protein